MAYFMAEFRLHQETSELKNSIFTCPSAKLWHGTYGTDMRESPATNAKGVTISMTQQSPRPHSSHISQQLNISAVEAAPETKNPF